jgi:putative SOS response-associated peptidase YedK
MRPIHDWMPVILGPEAWGPWLSPSTARPDLQSLLGLCPDDWLTAFPVSTRVNNPKNEGPACIELAA